MNEFAAMTENEQKESDHLTHVFLFLCMLVVVAFGAWPTTGASMSSAPPSARSSRRPR